MFRISKKKPCPNIFDWTGTVRPNRSYELKKIE